MGAPVKVGDLLNELTSVEEARTTPVSISVYIDEGAPAELAGHVRNAFASSSPQVRMTVSYLGASFIPNPTDDAAIIVANGSVQVGECADALRTVGVPVMVVTLQADELAQATAKAGHPVPDADIVAPTWEQDEPHEFDEKAALSLNDRMGRWIVSACRAKRLAFAIAFPFMRRPLAKDAVLLTSLENAGVGLVPLIPGADLPIMTVNQIKMVLQIAAAYGQPMDKNRVKEVAAVFAGAYLSRGLVRKLVAVVPVLGFAFKSGVAFGTTAAIGYGIIEYFEGGADVTGVANVIERAMQTSTKAASALQGKMGKITPLLPKRAEH